MFHLKLSIILITLFACLHLPVIEASSGSQRHGHASSSEEERARLHDEEIVQLNRYRVHHAAGGGDAGGQAARKVHAGDDHGYGELSRTYEERNRSRVSKNIKEVTVSDFINSLKHGEGYRPFKSALHNEELFSSWAAKDLQNAQTKSSPNADLRATMSTLDNNRKQWRAASSKLHCELLNGTKYADEHLVDLKRYDNKFVANKINLRMIKNRLDASGKRKADGPTTQRASLGPAERPKRHDKGKQVVVEKSQSHGRQSSKS